MKRVGLIATFVALGWTGSALAQDAEPTEGDAPREEAEARVVDPGAQERARLHFQSGASYYEAGSYEDALREWQRAYELSQRAELLYNLSLAHQGLNDLPQALDYLRRFLEEVEDIPNRANLQLRVDNLERRLAQDHGTEGTTATGTETGTTESGNGATSEADAPPETSDDGGSGPNVGAIAGFSVAGAGVVMFAIFGGLTLAEDGRLSDECATPCGPGAADDLRTFALISDIGFGLALAGAAVGTILLLVGMGGDDSDAAALPWFDRDGGGLALVGRM